MSTTLANIDDICFSKNTLTIRFDDGRQVTTPLDWYPRLKKATPEQRSHWQVLGKNRGIHWPDIDEDLSISAMLAGLHSQSSVRK